MHTTSGPALERKGDLAGLLTNLQERRRPLHRRDPPPQPRRRGDPLPGDGGLRLDIVIGQGPAARSIRLTCRRSRWSAPPRAPACSRRRCATASASGSGSTTTTSTSWRRSCAARRASSACASRTTRRREIAGRSRGTPRVANRLLRRVRDFAQVRHEGVVDARHRREALELLEVDDAGLDKLDRDILQAIAEKFDGGPVGLDTLAVALGEEADTIEDVYEPYLIMQRLPQAHAARARVTAAGFVTAARAARAGRTRSSTSERPAGRCGTAPRVYSLDDRPAPAHLLRTLLDRRRARLARARASSPWRWFDNPNIQPAAELERRLRRACRRYAGRPDSSWSSENGGGGRVAGRRWRRPGAAAPDDAAAPVSTCAWARPARRGRARAWPLRHVAHHESLPAPRSDRAARRGGGRRTWRRLRLRSTCATGSATASGEPPPGSLPPALLRLRGQQVGGLGQRRGAAGVEGAGGSMRGLHGSTELDYELPHGADRADASEPRDASRLLVVRGAAMGALDDRVLRRTAGLLRPGDVLVRNDTRVLPARVRFRRPPAVAWSCCSWDPRRRRGPARRQAAPRCEPLRPRSPASREVAGRARAVRRRLEGEVQRAAGRRTLAGRAPRRASRLARLHDAAASTPLPPYIKAALAERERYQTMYATRAGSAAAHGRAALHARARAALRAPA